MSPQGMRNPPCSHDSPIDEAPVLWRDKESPGDGAEHQAVLQAGKLNRRPVNHVKQLLEVLNEHSAQQQQTVSKHASRLMCKGTPMLHVQRVKSVSACL